ncbi:methyltransferase family protein [Streptomyces sp. JNUCC 64]
MALPNALALAGVLLWAAFEVLLRRRADPGAAAWTATPEDRGSTRLLLAAYAVAVLVNVVLAGTGAGSVPLGWCWAGVALVAVGLVLRAWAMRTLDRFYTRTLRTTEGQRLVTSGPYRLIRHPGYTGSLLVWTGYSLGLGNWIAPLVVAALLLAVYTWRVEAEERLLLAAFGDEYARYRLHTRRLVPYVY